MHDAVNSPNESAAPKYRNLAQFFQGVGAVNEPGLTDKEHRALTCLAAYADYRSGGKSRPGNATLMRWCSCADRSVRRILARLEQRKLIVRISPGWGGRGLATVWQICVWDDRFPKPKPGPSEGRVSKEKPGHNQGQVSQQETRTSQEQNPDTKNENPDMDPRKPGLLEDRTTNANLQSNQIQQKHTAQNPRGLSGDEGLLCSLKTVFEDRFRQLPCWSDIDVRQLDSLKKMRNDLPTEEVVNRYRNFVGSPIPFHRSQGGSLKFFVKNFDAFIEPVLNPNRSGGALPAELGKRRTEPERFWVGEGPPPRKRYL